MKEIDAPWYYTFEKHKTSYPIIGIGLLLFFAAILMHDHDIMYMIIHGQVGMENISQLYLNIANYDTLEAMRIMVLVGLAALIAYAIIVKIAQGKIRRDNPFAF